MVDEQPDGDPHGECEMEINNLLLQVEELKRQLDMSRAARGTDAQILKERELTIEAVNGAMAFGEMDTNPPPEPDHWLAPFWHIGRKRAELEAEINRRKGDPCTRLHNLCEAIAEEADGSEFSREEWERIDTENSRLRRDNAQLQYALEQSESSRIDGALYAARYCWLRGGDGSSTRYSRWRVEYFDGPNGWEPMQRERMDAAIDAAMKDRP